MIRNLKLNRISILALNSLTRTCGQPPCGVCVLIVIQSCGETWWLKFRKWNEEMFNFKPNMSFVEGETGVYAVNTHRKRPESGIWTGPFLLKSRKRTESSFLNGSNKAALPAPVHTSILWLDDELRRIGADLLRSSKKKRNWSCDLVS